jgi:hypothetical protein
MIVAALAIFQALIWVGVAIGKFLIDLGVRNLFRHKNYLVCEHASVWVAVSLHYHNGVNAVMG